MKIYTLTSIKTRDIITGTFEDAIQRAIAIEKEYQPWLGVEIWLDDELIAHIEDGAVTGEP